MAELIKNAYDADATLVDVVFAEDAIVVRDNGHGMTYEEFRHFWMRIGSTHKARQESSRTLGRPLTGSKGVGRLAAQFLAHELELRTVSAGTDREVFALVNWDEAVEAGELTRATALVDVVDADTAFPGGAAHGTWVRMDRLNGEWGPEELADLARELWPLQPPFDNPSIGQAPDEDAAAPEPVNVGTDTSLLEALLEELDAAEKIRGTRDARSFQVRLRAHDQAAVKRFEHQMARVLDLWSARITGVLEAPNVNDRVTGRLVVDVEFADGHEHARYEQTVPRSCLHRLEFEIRVFSLHHRQRYQIRVEDARKYLKDNGGVHVYDAGFHLPYYGVETDWLGIERDHANRLTLSQLLPDELNVERGLNALPTNRRLYGVVRIDTARERRMTGEERRLKDALTIQISRDRLADNNAFRQLRTLVRTALDFYAIEETRRMHTVRAAQPAEPAPAKARHVREVLARYRDEIPPTAYAALDDEVSGVLKAVESEAEAQAAQAGLLGSLATAGMAAIAFEHEFNRQLSELERLAHALRRANSLDEVAELADRVEKAVASARENRRLFSHVLDDSDQRDRQAFLARPVLDATRDQLRYSMRGVKVDHRGVAKDLRLPPGRMAEWGAIFQNVYVNAVNAMLDREERRIVARSWSQRTSRGIVIEDTGSGVDLEHGEDLFKPFERRQELSDDRRKLGFGGSGLGLTIVRMLATTLGCTVEFVEPSDGYCTALEVAWDVRI